MSDCADYSFPYSVQQYNTSLKLIDGTRHET